MFSHFTCLCGFQGQFRWIVCPLWWHCLKTASITIHKGISTGVVSPLLAQRVLFGSKNYCLFVRFKRKWGNISREGTWEAADDERMCASPHLICKRTSHILMVLVWTAFKCKVSKKWSVCSMVHIFHWNESIIHVPKLMCFYLTDCPRKGERFNHLELEGENRTFGQNKKRKRNRGQDTKGM